MVSFAGGTSHPGWPIQTGSVEVRAGLVSLRPIRRRDARAWSALRCSDRRFLEPWEPTTENEWSERNGPAAWASMSMELMKAAQRGATVPAVIELDGIYCGQITLGGISRGALSSGWIGYWVAHRYTGGGVASAALALALDHAFREVGLHRVDATVRPENLASRKVLERCGFRDEGLLRRYLHVDGQWRDHLLVATTVEEQGDGAVARLVEAGTVRKL